MINVQELKSKNTFNPELKTIKPTKFIQYNQYDLKLTDSTLQKILELKKQKATNILRIAINGGGCKGFQSEFITDQEENIGIKTRDIVLIKDNLMLISFDLFSEFYIKGSTINYISNIMESYFKIENSPKTKSTCSCSKSFASDEFFDGEFE
jgi:iron-sulfur cluster assembly accessory protein